MLNGKQVVAFNNNSLHGRYHRAVHCIEFCGGGVVGALCDFDDSVLVFQRSPLSPVFYPLV